MWWSEDEYNSNVLMPDEFRNFIGPRGAAVVQVYDNDKTAPGWGQDMFMKKYQRGMFSGERNLAVLDRPFAFVMRSMQLVCIDIDGKNGGLQHVGKLGMLPYTLAETSKSGNGYHLFYSTEEDTWDSELGFAGYRDRIAIQQGVDFRATGCVFHYPAQRWNNRPIAELPQHMKDMLTQHTQKATATVVAITKTLEAGDAEEVAIMHDNLIEDLGKPIPQGRRNNTLFAVGSQLFLAQVPDWEKLVRDRAKAVGLDHDEVTKLIRNIEKYGANA